MSVSEVEGLTEVDFTQDNGQRLAESTEDASSTLGLDLGYRTTGFALYSGPESRVTVWGSLNHTTRTEKGDIVSRMESRRRLRSTRRSRLWYREPRFDNRRHDNVSHGRWIQPVIRSKLAAHLKLLRWLGSRHDIDLIMVEGGQFDARRLKLGRSLAPWEYQRGPRHGYENLKAYIRDRDNYTCQYCGKDTGCMTVDHILPRSTHPQLVEETTNMVCACEECNHEKGTRTAAEFGHEDIHDLVKQRDGLCLRAAAGMNYLNSVLIDWLEGGRLYVEEEYQGEPAAFDVGVTYGSYTKAGREAIGWPKTHRHDAATIATHGENVLLPSKYLYMRWAGREVRQKTREKRDPGGRLPRRVTNQQLKVNGTVFRRGDYVEYRGRNRTERGFIQSLLSNGSAKVCGPDGGSDIKGTWTLKNIVKLADAPRLRYEFRSH